MHAPLLALVLALRCQSYDAPMGGSVRVINIDPISSSVPAPAVPPVPVVPPVPAVAALHGHSAMHNLRLASAATPSSSALPRLLGNWPSASDKVSVSEDRSVDWFTSTFRPTISCALPNWFFQKS